MPLRVDLTLTLVDDGATFLVETSDVQATVPAGDVLGIMPPELKYALRQAARGQAEATRSVRDQAEAERADALARRKAADEDLASASALAESLPAPPDEAAPQTPA
jgi:hypothetical protein